MILTATKPAFVTSRLRVFAFLTSETDLHVSRWCFVAYFIGTDWPGHVVTATVMPACPAMPPYLDWIETSSQHRRLGYGRELIEGIEKYIGQEILMDGATPEGEAFCEAMTTKEHPHDD